MLLGASSLLEPSWKSKHGLLLYMKLNEREDRINYFNHLVKCFGHAKLRLVKHYRFPGKYSPYPNRSSTWTVWSAWTVWARLELTFKNWLKGIKSPWRNWILTLIRMLYGSNAKKNLIKNTFNHLFGSDFWKTTREEFFLATHISIFWNSECFQTF